VEKFSFLRYQISDIGYLISEWFLVPGDVAQLGERVVRNDEAVGSIPIISTNKKTVSRIPLTVSRIQNRIDSP
jgi:hypothetical protein